MDGNKTQINVLEGKTIKEAAFFRNVEENGFTFEFFTEEGQVFYLTIRSMPTVTVGAADKVYTKSERLIYEHDNIQPDEPAIFEL